MEIIHQSEKPQPNPKPHPVDWLALIFVGCGAIAELSDVVPDKWSGVFIFLGFCARTYTKYVGVTINNPQDVGAEIGKEIAKDIKIFKGDKTDEHK